MLRNYSDQERQPSHRMVAEERRSEFDPSEGAKPYSPFYRHATPKLIGLPFGIELQRGTRGGAAKKKKKKLNGRDLEAAGDRTRLNILWVDEHQDQGGCLERLEWRKRLVVESLIAVVVLSCMIAFAFGISTALKAVRGSFRLQA